MIKRSPLPQRRSRIRSESDAHKAKRLAARNSAPSRRYEPQQFVTDFGDLPDGAFFALAGEMGIEPEDFIPPTNPKRARVKRRNAKRRKREWLRAYGSPERCDFVSSLPCVGCRVEGNCENVHIKSGGKGRKADARFIVPGCHDCHHNELHAHGRASFEAKFGVDLDVAAAETEALWQKHVALTAGEP